MGMWKGFSHFTFKVCLHPSHGMYPDKGKCENENFIDSKVATVLNLYVPQKLQCVQYV